MTDFSQRLREPAFLVILAIAIAGWLAFLAMWINAGNAAGEAQRQVATLTQERDAGRTQLAEHETAAGTLTDLQGQIETGRQQLAELGASLETAGGEVATRMQELTELAANIEARRAELTTAEQTAAEAAARTKQLLDEQATLTADTDSATQQLTDIGTRLATARQQEEVATANLAKLTEDAAAATTALADVEAQLQKARTDLAAQQEEASAKANELQGQIDVLQPQVTELTQTLAERSAELQDIEARIAEARNSDATEVYAVANGTRLSLAEGGTFTLENTDGRSVTGDFTRGNGTLVLRNANGAFGTASFPMTCPVVDNATGFVVGQGCPLAGLEFSRQ